ncbi:STAS-like domain-containing protein [Hoeflea sp.]|uniref:STAS-like domain-containing protein n=1 Tax=Hoeflea sp. TaxID=1940281 RepID=UPI003A92378B
MLNEIKIDIAKDFSPYPVGRDENDSAVNGKKFRTEKLAPAVKSALEQDRIVVIILEGLESVGSSFLEEAFGGLVRNENFTASQLKSVLKFDYEWPGFKTPEEQIWEHILRAQREKA